MTKTFCVLAVWHWCWWWGAGNWWRNVGRDRGGAVWMWPSSEVSYAVWGTFTFTGEWHCKFWSIEALQEKNILFMNAKFLN